MKSIAPWIDKAIDNHSPETRVLGTGRSLIALAQLSIIVLTPSSNLLNIPVKGQPTKPSCEGIGNMGAFCVFPQEISWLAKSVLVLALVIVISGIYPRITSWLHVWATFSISVGISLPDGGEQAAQVLVVLIALVLLGDNRRNHWSSGSSQRRNSVLLGVSTASHILLRLQIAFIYIDAAITKTAVQEWQEGSAVYYVSRGAYFGVSGPLSDLVLWVTEKPLVSLVLTWGTIVLELAIAFFILLKVKFRWVALAVCTLLHIGIILIIGLWSFALVMIGGTCCAVLRLPRADRQEIDSSPVPEQLGK